jgi:hypothetical protein
MRVDGADGIVVVGGYGSVGRTVCAELAGRFPGRVFAAGRDLGRAEAFSREMGGTVLPLRLDLAGAAGPQAPGDARGPGHRPWPVALGVRRVRGRGGS